MTDCNHFWLPSQTNKSETHEYVYEVYCAKCLDIKQLT